MLIVLSIILQDSALLQDLANKLRVLAVLSPFPARRSEFLVCQTASNPYRHVSEP
jgi:hypothetical protein